MRHRMCQPGFLLAAVSALGQAGPFQNINNVYQSLSPVLCTLQALDSVHSLHSNLISKVPQ